MKTLIIGSIIALFITSSIEIKAQSCYRENPYHTGCYTGPGATGALSVGWKFKTQGRVFSSPVIYHSLVFVGSDDSCFYAIDRSNGSLIWKFRTGGRISSGAAISDNVVYINSFDGYVYALKTGDGILLWKYNTGGDRVFSARNLHGVNTNGKFVNDPWDMYLSSPVVGNGKLYIGSGNGNVYALDLKTGQLIWKFKTGGVVHVSPALSGDSVYFASWDSYIYALNANCGKEIWRFKTGIDTINYNQVGFQSSPAISGNMLYIGCRDAQMRAINRFTGKLLWKFSTNGSWIIGSPAIFKHRLYFGTSDTYRVLALDAVTGKVIFDRPAKSYLFSSPAIAGDKLYIGTFGGFLYEMDCNTGETGSIFRTDASVKNGSLYLNADSTINNAAVFSNPSWDGMLQGIQRLYLLGSILSSPAIAGKEIYVGSTDGYVYDLK